MNIARRPRPSVQGCVHELFEAQVNRDPNAITILSDTAQLTCNEVNRRANETRALLGCPRVPSSVEGRGGALGQGPAHPATPPILS